MRRNWIGIVSPDMPSSLGLVVSNRTNRLVDDITNRVALKNGAPGTATAILGPFWRADTPVRANGSTIALKCPDDGELAFMYGQVTCSNTGKPLANASVDVWQASTNGQSPMKCCIGP